MKLYTTITYAFLLSLAYASPALVASPTITPAARLRRADLQTFAWTSNSTENGETFYSPWKYNPEVSTWTTSDDYFRRCSVGSTCNMWTACSEGWMVGKGTSSSCGAGGAEGSVFCSNNILFESMGATRTYSWYWCDSAPITGYTFYQEEPPQPTRATASSPASTDASTTTSTASSQSSSISTTTTGTASPSATNDSKFSISIGGVAGGVIGGLVGLAAIGLGVFFLLRRRKRRALYPPPTAGYAPPTEHQQNPFDTPASSYATPYLGGLEAKPPGVDAWGAPAAYPQGLYDPHYGAAEMPAQSTTVVRNGAMEMEAGGPTNYAQGGNDVPLQPIIAAELPSQSQAPQELPVPR